MKIISWNVNGIIACRRKGFLRFLADTKPDIMCCQEVKTKCALNTPGYQQFWNPAVRPGYSGTLILAKQEPLSWSTGFGNGKFDEEGRLITLEYADYYIINVYVPSVHPHNSPDRPDFRLEWDEALREYIANLPKPVVLCGDFNVTHAYIDSYPENGKNEPDNPLFRSEVRDGFDKLLAAGVVDAFRVLNPNKEGAYTWWGPKNKNRAENRGSRLDYFLVSGELLSFVQSIRFHKDILASDHCPISMLFYPIRPKRELDDEDMTAITPKTLIQPCGTCGKQFKILDSDLLSEVSKQTAEHDKPFKEGYLPSADVLYREQSPRHYSQGNFLPGEGGDGPPGQ